jgi:alkanesulfonate monooxygenase SsuD/methylene tetrahydromethanopterin reductase-like flavin-dependent oxidoreductase (luciferase family)
MKFGLLLGLQFLPGENPVQRYKETLNQVDLARKVGFQSVFLVQHYLADFQFLQTVPMLGRLSEITGNMLLGTAIYLLALHHPVEVAEQFATLDVMTEGRVVLGIGIGYRDKEFATFGVNKKDRVSRFEESVSIIRRLWSGEVVTHSGKHFHLEQVQLMLLPVKRQLPVWIGAIAEKAIHRAATLGDAWIISPELSFGEIKEKMAIYRSALRDAGMSEDREYPILRETSIGISREQAIDNVWSFLKKKYDTYRSWGHISGDLESMINESFILGTPDEVMDQICRYHEEIGVNHFIFRVQWPGMDQQTVLNNIRILGEKIIPRLS